MPRSVTTPSFAMLVPQPYAPTDEGMAQIVDAWSGMAAASRPAQVFAKSTEDPMDRPLVQGRTLGRDQERSVLQSHYVALAQSQILLQGLYGRRVQGDQPRLCELGLPHRQHAGIEIDIVAREPQGFR